MIVAAVLVGCEDKKPGEPPRAQAAAAPRCELAGDYRVRFFANGTEGWWLRFKIAGSPLTAEATAPQAMLELAPGPLAVTGDPATCGLVLALDSDNAGAVKVTMTVDPATGAVTGALTRTKHLAGDPPSVPVTGYRGPDAPPKGRECIAPGIYELGFDRAHPWKNDEAEDDRSCKDDVIADHTAGQYLRVEWLGDQLAIDQVVRKGDAAWSDDFGAETVSSSGCDVTLAMPGDGVNLEGKVTFVDGAARGVASKATLKIIQDRDGAEDVWDCVAADLPINLARVKQP